MLNKKIEKTWREAPRIRYNLWRFIEEFKKGDRVVVPGLKVFSVYELVSKKSLPISNIPVKDLTDWNGKLLTMKNGLLDRENDLIDLGFYWEVKPIAKNISRRDFAHAALTRRMKIRPINTCINDLKDSVEKALNLFKKNTPINLYS